MKPAFFSRTTWRVDLFSFVSMAVFLIGFFVTHGFIQFLWVSFFFLFNAMLLVSTLVSNHRLKADLPRYERLEKALQIIAEGLNKPSDQGKKN